MNVHQQKISIMTLRLKTILFNIFNYQVWGAMFAYYCSSNYLDIEVGPHHCRLQLAMWKTNHSVSFKHKQIQMQTFN